VKNRLSPGAVLTLGLLLVSIAFLLWAAQVTALEPGPLHRSAGEVLSESPARNAMVTRLTRDLVTDVPTAAGVDPATLTAIATAAVDQPEFVTAFAGALDHLQTHVVDGTIEPITLDPALVSQAVRTAATAANQPQLAAAVATSAPLVIDVPVDHVPDLAHWADLWKAAVRALAFIGLLLVTYGMLKIEHRLWAVGRIGRWSIGVGLTTLAVFWLLPRALLRPLGGWIAVGGAVLASGDLVVPVSLALVGIGTVTVIAAHRGELHDRKRVLSEIPRAMTRSRKSTWESPV
jgi:hypothetical protein